MQAVAMMYPSQYRKYLKLWNEAYAVNPQYFNDSGFEWLAKHAKRVGGSYKISNGMIFRVFFPIYVEPELPTSMLEVFKDAKYTLDASKQEVTDRHGRHVSAGKAYQQLAKKAGVPEETIKSVLETYAEVFGSSGAMLLCVSRHPYDIAGMSTGRAAWSSCHTLGGDVPKEKARKKAKYATNYRIYWKQAGTKKWRTLATVKSNRTSYTHKSNSKARLVAGKKYVYTVRAYNKYGKKWSSYNTRRKTVTIPKKKVVTPTKPTTKPSIPTPVPTKKPQPTATPVPAKPTATPNPTATPVPATPTPAPVKVSNVTVNPATVKLTSKGQNTQLSVSVLPSNAENKSIVWSTSNASVATVDNNGVVTAVANGSTLFSSKYTRLGWNADTQVYSWNNAGNDVISGMKQGAMVPIFSAALSCIWRVTWV